MTLVLVHEKVMMLIWIMYFEIVVLGATSSFSFFFSLFYVHIIPNHCTVHFTCLMSPILVSICVLHGLSKIRCKWSSSLMKKKWANDYVMEETCFDCLGHGLELALTCDLLYGFGMGEMICWMHFWFPWLGIHAAFILSTFCISLTVNFISSYGRTILDS